MITPRDLFAAHALAGILGNRPIDPEYVAEMAWACADAMEAERLSRVRAERAERPPPTLMPGPGQRTEP